MSEEQVLDDMRDENAMIERFLTGEYPRWPGKAESVARDVARRYMLARTNVQQLRAEVERLTADLSTCQDGNVDLLNENQELKRQMYELSVQLDQRTKSLKGANEMVNAWSDAAIQQNAKVNTLTAERDAAIVACAGLLPFIVEDGIAEEYWTDEFRAAVHAARAVIPQDGQP